MHLDDLDPDFLMAVSWEFPSAPEGPLTLSSLPMGLCADDGLPLVPTLGVFLTSLLATYHWFPAREISVFLIAHAINLGALG